MVYWPQSLFMFLWTSSSTRALKTQRRTWLISSHLDVVLGQYTLFYCKMIFWGLDFLFGLGKILSPCSLVFRLGVANSELLRCYMSLDPRIPQLIFIVKAWAKAKGLSVYRQLSNYALTVLVLYFLQIQVPPVIPSLQQGFSAWMKKETDEHYASCIYLEPQPIDSWDCSFFKDFSRLMPSINAKSVGKLMPR